MDKKKLFKVSGLALAALGVSALGALTAMGGTLSLKSKKYSEELVRAGRFNSTSYTANVTFTGPNDGNYTLDGPISGNVQLRLLITNGKFGDINSNSFNATNGTANCTFQKFSDTLLYAPSTSCTMFSGNNFYFNGTLPIIISNNAPDSGPVKLKLEIRSSDGSNVLESSGQSDLITFSPQFKEAKVIQQLNPSEVSYEYDFAKFSNGNTQANATVRIDVDTDNFDSLADNATIEISLGSSLPSWASNMTVSGAINTSPTTGFNNSTNSVNATINGTSDTDLTFTLNLKGNETVPAGSEIKIASIKTLYFNNDNTNLKYQRTLGSNLSLGTITYKGTTIYIPNVYLPPSDNSTNTIIKLQTAKSGVKAKIFVLKPNTGWVQVGDEITLNQGLTMLDMRQLLTDTSYLTNGTTAVKIFTPVSNTDITCYAATVGTNGVRRVPCIGDKGVE